MSREKGSIGLIVVIVVVVAGILVWVAMAGNKEIKEADMMMEKEEKMIEEEEMMLDGEDEVMDDELSIAVDANLATGFFKDYTSMEDLSKGPEDKVLFFHASWCPSCRSLESSLNSNDIPDGLGIYKIDYDSSTELKSKYGVTTQHTLVQVDSEGNMINKWLGGNDVESIVNNLE